VLLSRREREIRQAHAGITATATWQPVGARGGRVARMAGQRGGKRGQGHGEDDAWEEGKQDVDGGGLHSGGRRGSCTGGRAGEAEEQRAKGVHRKKKRGRRSGGPVCENQKLQGPHSKERFPTDLEVF
jgi:hypothetical protein